MKTFKQKRAGEACAGTLALIFFVAYIASKVAGLDLSQIASKM